MSDLSASTRRMESFEAIGTDIGVEFIYRHQVSCSLSEKASRSITDILPSLAPLITNPMHMIGFQYCDIKYSRLIKIIIAVIYPYSTLLSSYAQISALPRLT